MWTTVESTFTNVGTMDNVDIGQTTPGQAKFYELDLVSAPDSTASVINANNTTYRRLE